MAKVEAEGRASNARVAHDSEHGSTQVPGEGSSRRIPSKAIVEAEVA